MAKSGTINGSRSGRRPYLRINWNITEQQVSNNRSRVRLRLYLMHPYPVYYSATKSGSLYGTSFSSTTNVSGTGSTLLRTQHVWVNHNSDGTKTQSVSASLNIAITFSGSWMGSISASGNMSLDRIPRKSDLNSASIGSVKPGGDVNLVISRSVKHSDFYHLVTILDNGSWVADWGYNKGAPPTSLSLNNNAINRILSRMSNTTSKTFTVRLRTYTGSGGSGLIGTSTKSVTVNVDSSVKPNIIETSVEQVGSQWAIDKGMYVQGQSGVRAEFRSSASGGANVRSRNIKISNTNGGSVVGSVFRHQINTLNNTGNITIKYTITDTRGRSASSSRTIYINPYSPPRITSLTATRQENTPTRVTVYRSGTHTSLGGANSARMLIERKSGTGAWTTVQDTRDSGGSWGNSATSTGNSVTSSYDFRATLTDVFGNTAEATVTVSTQRVVLDIHKDEGVGIGKIHEQGVLDIDGDVYSNGILYTVGGLGSISIPAGDDLNDYTANGFYHNRTNNATRQIANTPENNAFSLLVQKHAGVQQTFTTYGGSSGNTWRQYIRNQYNGSWGPWRQTNAPERGNNSNGNWVRYSDGTQICWHITTVVYTSSGRFLERYWSYPVDFVNDRTSGSVIRDNYWGARTETDAIPTIWHGSTSAQIRLWSPPGSSFSSGNTARVSVVAIGRWK